MNNELSNQINPEVLARLILDGDLSKLNPQQKVEYYKKVCDSQGLNPLTQPFSYIRFQGKEVLYAGKNCTEQLRDINGISLKIVDRQKIDDLYVVTAEATNKNGRCDSSTGAVNLKGLSGDALANALMKAETKAKRRVTLSISGLGFLDETETETIPGAQKLNIDMETGEIIDAVSEQSKPVEQTVIPKATSDFLNKDQVFRLSKMIFDAKINAKEIYDKYNVKSYEQLTNAQAKEISQDCQARLMSV